MSEQDPRRAPFISSLSIRRLAALTGSAADFRKSLETQLTEFNVDPSPAVTNLPEGQEDLEAVARLVSLARGHGLIVTLPDTPLTGGGQITVVSSSSPQMLQSGHDQM